ncbi:hypothetical protein CANARDRAFT_30497 [[Candida] arabinofermentans NRRL YB-2248]|uniref:Pre-mRNA processing factor 4 (PRP4)-like domain-containing protein n=1 Tax=[Candida] arabinofermentans NRRL YB-2248 TaxID=983967 RepID=A0A1E4STL7_9ASCO|nr:hypothetical protein CANARDRAFT_30497 [[Candida] arabinofermentans NRRL YB-2248]
MIPTLDEDVRKLLQQLGHPQTEYGEDNITRRERLIKLINDDSVKQQLQNMQADDDDAMVEGSSNDDEDEDFYTPGTSELYDLRIEIANESLINAKNRILNQQIQYDNINEIEILQQRRTYNDNLKLFELEGVQTISNRFTSCVKFNNNNKIYAGSWDGKTYKLDDNLNKQGFLNGFHESKVGDVEFHPIDNNIMATCGNEGLINIYNNEQLQTSLKGHDGRITSLSFNPINNLNLLVSASHDKTWRLYDVSTTKEIYYQEGHSKELTSISHQIDGSLLSSSSIDNLIKLWDLRSGLNIANLSDHTNGVYCLQWRLNGYELISGGGDNLIKVWDIRNYKKPKHNLISHTKLVSDLKISNDDKFMISCGYDGLLNIHSCDSWLNLKKFKNTDKLMTCDISNDMKSIITGGWNRSIQLYKLLTN